MNEITIKEKIRIAIDALFSNDAWLLENDLCERSITHKLAEYMQPLFLKYNVDCEYNGDAMREDGRKRIHMLKIELKKMGLIQKKDETTDSELTDRLVFPDIIVHVRGKGGHAHNLCIIEVKKSTNNNSSEYDKIKLQAYTTEQHGNDLKYKIGLFIEFVTMTNDIGYNIKYFVNGIETGSESKVVR